MKKNKNYYKRFCGKSILSYLLMNVLVLDLVACGSTSSKIESTTEVSQIETTESKEEDDNRFDKYDNYESIKDIWVGYPNDCWSGEYDESLDAYNLNRESYTFLTGDPTIMFYTEKLSAEDSLVATKSFDESIYEVEDRESIELCGVECSVIRSSSKRSPKIIDKVFYPVNNNKCLRFSVFVSVNNVKGLSLDDEEVIYVMESIIELNGFDTASDGDSDEEQTEKERIEIKADDINVKCTNYDIGLFTLNAPAGWNAFNGFNYLKQEESNDSAYVIKGGENRNDNEYKPYIYFDYDTERDAYTNYVRERKGRQRETEYKEYEYIINDTICFAFESKYGSESEGSYQKYLMIFYPVSDNSCMTISISLESSDFDGLSMDDEDVKAIVSGFKVK